jgi:WD40 repeat protein
MIKSLGYSRSTGWLFSASSDATVRVWDIKNLRCLRTHEIEGAAVEDMVLLGEGNRCILADDAGFLQIWKPSIGPAASFLLSQPKTQVAMSEDQSRLQFIEQQAKKANLAGDQLRAISLIDEARQVDGYYHSPKLLGLRHSYASSLDQTSIGETFDRYVWREHRGPVHVIVGLTDYAASGGEDGCLILWNIEAGKSDFSIAAHSGCLRALAVNGHGTLLVTGGDDGVVRRLNIGDRTTLYGRGHYKIIFDVTFMPDGGSAVSSGQDGTLRVWNACSWDCRQTLRPGGNKAPSMTEIMSRAILSIVVGADGRSVFAGGQGNVRMWDLEQGAIV